MPVGIPSKLLILQQIHAISWTLLEGPTSVLIHTQEQCSLVMASKKLVWSRLNQTNLDAARSRCEIKRLDDFVIGQTGIVVEFLDCFVRASLKQTHATTVIGGKG